MENEMNFQSQAEQFMASIQTRRRSPVKARTVAAYKSHLNSHILPALGEKPLSSIENGTLKTFVAELSSRDLAASTINSMVSLVKQIVASAVDANGNQLYPRTWNSDFMDLPVVSPRSQTAPVATAKGVQQAISQAVGQEKALYALLAGSGLRIGEALALKVGPDNGQDSYWAPETGTVTIRTTRALHAGGIQSTPKTEAGIRQIDLDPALNDFLKTIFHDFSQSWPGLVFRNAYGGPVRFNTLREHAEEADIECRFHAFRRFRVTHLRKAGVPEGLVQFWTGHAGKSITDRYDKIGVDVEARKEWAQKAGLGFQLETK
jgi:integrase